MSKTLTKIILVLIIFLFLFTRLYKISEIPASVYWDEASIGYNAYAISKDLKDEWGEFLPLHFRAFGEFKLPVFIYSVVPFVKIFGLNEFSVRVPAVLYSLGVVILTFFLSRKLTGNNFIGLWASFFITISPWFFIFSRTGFEATAGLMFYLLGILFFLQNEKGGKFFVLSALSFILSAYSYNSFRIIAPLTILFLIFSERAGIERLFKHFKWATLSITLIILSVLPIYRLYVYDAGISRVLAVGSADAGSFLKNYISHFDPRFLFIQGDSNLRHQQIGFGQLFFPEALLVAAGFIYILKSKSKYKWLPILLILLSPIPAAITKESPHALRSLSIVPFISMISAMGVSMLRSYRIPSSYLNIGIVLLMLGFFINYFISFLNIYPAQSSKEWQYGYKKIFMEAGLNKKSTILISDKDGQPYIFALFYLKYDPQKFRNEVVRNPVSDWGFSTVKNFGNFEFVKSNE